MYRIQRPSSPVTFRLRPTDIQAALSSLELPISEIIGSGGGETQFTQRLRRSLAARGWPKHVFEITKTVDGQPRQSTSHEIDHVHRSANGVIALEIEWNNKDPFFDRDLENFKRLHAEGAISVGVLITLIARIDRGVGNSCPLVLIGLPATMIRFYSAAVELLDDSAASDAVPDT